MAADAFVPNLSPAVLARPGTDASGILVVDDREANLKVLESLLVPLGRPVRMVTSGEAALRHLLDHEVSVIILDVQMPGMDGLETARHIKERKRTQEIPIIFFTAGDAGVPEVMSGFSTGAVDYLTKPFDPDVFQAKVRVFLELSDRGRMLRSQRQLLAYRLDEHLESEARNLRQLAEAALAINSTLALDDMLKVINESARQVIGATEAETVLTGGPRPCGGGLSELHDLVIRGGWPVRLTRRELEINLSAWGLSDAAGHPMMQGWLAAPLVGRDGRRLGLIQVGQKLSGDFTLTDEVVLLQLAQLAAVAIENHQRYEQQHDIAEILQASLRPEALPVVPGLELAARYQPGGNGVAVGGDWHDVIGLDDGRLALVVGDVAGHGPRAAVVMGQVRTAIRAYTIQGLSPSEIMAGADRLLAGLGAPLATVVYLLVDPSRRELEVVVAGHPPPLLIAPDGEAVFLGCRPNAPLGALLVSSFESSTVSLEAGSVLLAYTDGLVERRSASLSDGLEALAEAARAEAGVQDLDRFCATVLRAMAPGADADDIALLAARVS